MSFYLKSGIFHEPGSPQDALLSKTLHVVLKCAAYRVERNRRLGKVSLDGQRAKEERQHLREMFGWGTIGRTSQDVETVAEG